MLAIKECKEITLLCHLHYVEFIFLSGKCKQDRESYLDIVGIYLASYINLAYCGLVAMILGATLIYLPHLAS